MFQLFRELPKGPISVLSDLGCWHGVGILWMSGGCWQQGRVGAAYFCKSRELAVLQINTRGRGRERDRDYELLNKKSASLFNWEMIGTVLVKMNHSKRSFRGSQNLYSVCLVRVFPCMKPVHRDCKKWLFFKKSTDGNAKLWDTWRKREIWPKKKNKINLQELILNKWGIWTPDKGLKIKILFVLKKTMHVQNKNINKEVDKKKDKWKQKCWSWRIQ